METTDYNELLQEPLKVLEKSCPDACFKRIAEELINNYCINCDGKEFYLAEIEFYYYQNNSKGIMKEPWNMVTYARTGKNAGELFFHLSGVDICFDSSYENGSAQFGGILIRSVIDEENKLFTGPLNCKDLFLNTCSNRMPILERIKKRTGHKNHCMSTRRLLGKKDMEDKIDPCNLCFYDGNIEDWNTINERYDKKTNLIKRVQKKYDMNRPY
jgi:hypothetical protein